MNPSKNFLRETMKFLPKLCGVFRVRREIDWPSVFEKDDIIRFTCCFVVQNNFFYLEKMYEKIFAGGPSTNFDLWPSCM